MLRHNGGVNDSMKAISVFGSCLGIIFFFCLFVYLWSHLMTHTILFIFVILFSGVVVLFKCLACYPLPKAINTRRVRNVGGVRWKKIGQSADLLEIRTQFQSAKCISKNEKIRCEFPNLELTARFALRNPPTCGASRVGRQLFNLICAARTAAHAQFANKEYQHMIPWETVNFFRKCE